MKDYPGSPGTVLGFVLRMSQFFFAAGSIASMVTTSGIFNFTAFCYLIASMCLQVIWSFMLALLDAYVIVRKKVINNPVLVSLFVAGGIVVAGLIIYIQLWCIEKKGPVFVTVFNPLSTILVAILAYFVFGEKLYLGR
ncbi:hypothetical protein TanjilG_32123 [Lupinus angustifolius]|uniref:CASP-like protein n=1 Tax=Lupinus angustifolius TaxID=3871 RepID=A0A1J7HJZ5_LUPAN|nr:hypothetical protein TanjilG_32123 [Lupinus angustifolius]